MLNFKRRVFPTIAGTVLAVGATFGLVSPASATAEGLSTTETTNAATYEVEVNGATVSLEEGEVATFPMVGVQPAGGAGEVTTQGTYTGNWGFLKTWGSGGRFYYSIAMTKPANSFSGTASTTNLTNGQRGGIVPVSGFSSSIPTSNLKGHKYSGTLNGTAYLSGVPVATTMQNYAIWTNK